MSFPGLRALKALCVADENRDGYISQKEFIKLMRKKYRK
jgi:calcium-binding protein CML